MKTMNYLSDGSDIERGIKMQKGCTFGEVIQTLSEDMTKRAYREGWHGKNMWIYVEPGKNLKNLRDPLAIWIGRNAVEVKAHFNLYVDDVLVSGWLASQTDMLANDWVII